MSTVGIIEKQDKRRTRRNLSGIDVTEKFGTWINDLYVIGWNMTVDGEKIAVPGRGFEIVLECRARLTAGICGEQRIVSTSELLTADIKACKKCRKGSAAQAANKGARKLDDTALAKVNRWYRKHYEACFETETLKDAVRSYHDCVEMFRQEPCLLEEMELGDAGIIEPGLRKLLAQVFFLDRTHTTGQLNEWYAGYTRACIGGKEKVLPLSAFLAMMASEEDFASPSVKPYLRQRWSLEELQALHQFVADKYPIQFAKAKEMPDEL